MDVYIFVYACMIFEFFRVLSVSLNTYVIVCACMCLCVCICEIYICHGAVCVCICICVPMCVRVPDCVFCVKVGFTSALTLCVCRCVSVMFYWRVGSSCLYVCRYVFVNVRVCVFVHLCVFDVDAYLGLLNCGLYFLISIHSLFIYVWSVVLFEHWYSGKISNLGDLFCTQSSKWR